MQVESVMVGRRSRTGEFDARKATAAAALLVKGTGESMYLVMKMMYLADRFHLERYGRFIAGDSYAAMKEGPVPRLTYDLMKHLRGEPQRIADADVAKEYLVYGESHQLSLRREPDLDELSESEIECIEEVIALHKQLGPRILCDMSHDEAWRETWSTRYWRKSVPMDKETIASNLDAAEALLEHIRDPHPGTA